MDIVSLNNYSSMFQNYKVPVIPTISMEQVQEQERNVVQTVPEQQYIQEITPVHIVNADLEDISFTFNKQESFDYLGQESDIENLDIQKAISDMKKDTLLTQYQYFVGNITQQNNTIDGMVIAK